MMRCRIGRRIALVTMIGSPLGGALVTAAELRAAGHASLARRVSLIGGALGAVVLLALPLLAIRWEGIALLLLGVNAFAAITFAWLAHGDPTPPPMERPRPLAGPALWHILGNALLTSYVGAGAGVLYLLAADPVTSTLFPSIASRSQAIWAVTTLFLEFAVLGAMVGAVQIWRTPEVSARQRAGAIAGSVIGYFVAHACGTVLLDVPAFQGQSMHSRPATPMDGLAALVSMLVMAGISGGAVLAASRMLAARAHAPWSVRARAVGLVAMVTLASVASLVVYSGRQSYCLLLAGEQFERGGRYALAEHAYATGLAQHTDGSVNAHLQYRLALVYRKRGLDAEARGGFARVVTTHSSEQTLVARAQRFVAALDRAPADARRVTLDGISTRTEFKSAYCVPNSLSLVLRHWGVSTSAKRIGRDITALDIGTTVGAITWYVQQHGLDHWTMALADIDDLRALLDQGFPLLIYVPQHVIAVVGYDDALGSLITYDVAEADIWIDRPIGEVLAQWKSEFAVVGLVLPRARFASLPVTQRERLERSTRAFVHHDLHHAPHHSRDDEDQDRALAHLERSISAAPELFFDTAHVVVRPTWAGQRDAKLYAAPELAAAADRALAFARFDFDDDEALRELALLNLELGRYEALQQFLAGRYQEGTLRNHQDLVSLLGLLEYRNDRPDAAVSYLSAQKGRRRFSLVLARALESTGGTRAALDEYRALVELAVTPKGENGNGSDDNGSTSLLYFAKDRRTAPEAAAAMGRIVALAHSIGDPEWVRSSAGGYLKRHPWDADLQLAYAESIAAKLEREPALPDANRQELGRELKRSLALARLLDLSHTRAPRIDRIARTFSDAAGTRFDLATGS